MGPTNIGDTQMVFRERVLRAGILTRDRWLGRRVKWHIEWKKPDLWVGVFWRCHKTEDYGIEYVYAWEIWVCALPCLPVCVTTYGHDARPKGWNAGWWRAQPWRWHYTAIYRAHREQGDHRTTAAWRSLTFPHLHAEGEGDESA